MSFLSIEDAWDFACLVQYHDSICRQDLHRGLITSERDYVSNMATHLRYPSGSIIDGTVASLTGLPLPVFNGKINSFTLPPSTEQRLGFDSIIVLSRPGEKSGQLLHKVGLYEAKWPRAFDVHPSLGPSQTRDDWDNARGGASHFSRQLILQSALAGTDIVTWEQFFSEEPVGQSSNGAYKPLGSTCVLSHQALAYMRSQAALDPNNGSVKNSSWKWRHLEQMFQQQASMSLRLLMFLLGNCSLGKPIPGTADEVRITIPSISREALPTINQPLADILVDGQLVIPIPSGLPNSVATVQKSMRDFGLRSYTHFLFDDDAAGRLQAERRKKKLDTLLKEITAGL